MCKIKVKSNDQAVQCNKCELWQHTTCINMAQTTYNALKKTAKVKNELKMVPALRHLQYEDMLKK